MNDRIALAILGEIRLIRLILEQENAPPIRGTNTEYEEARCDAEERRRDAETPDTGAGVR